MARRMVARRMTAVIQKLVLWMLAIYAALSTHSSSSPKTPTEKDRWPARWGWGNVGRLGYANTDTIGDDENPALAGDVQVY